MKKIFTILGMAAVSVSMSAQTNVLTESFTYADAISLTTSNTTTNWFQHSGTQGQVTVNSGKANIVAGNTEDINKALSTPYPLNVANAVCKVSYSAELNVLNSTGLTTSGDYFLSLGDVATTTNVSTNAVSVLPARVYVKAGTAGYLLGILNTSGGTVTPTYSTTEIPYGTAANITVTYTVTNGSSTTQSATLQIGSQPLLTNATGTSNAPSNAASVVIRQSGSATSGTGNITIDNINVLAYPTGSLAVSDFNKSKSNFVKNTFVKNEEITFGADVKDVKIYTLTGQVVKTASVKDGAALNVAELAKGNYIVTGTVNNQPVSQKILKD